MRTGQGVEKGKPDTEMHSALERPRFISAAVSWVIADAPGLREIRSVFILEALCVALFISGLHI